MSNSVWPHRWQPTRHPHPWDSPSKNTGVGCHFLLQCMKVKSERKVAQSCLTLSDPMDRSLLGSSIHGIFQARVLEWGAIAFSVMEYYSTIKKEQNNAICSNMKAAKDYYNREVVLRWQRNRRGRPLSPPQNSSKEHLSAKQIPQNFWMLAEDIRHPEKQPIVFKRR